MNNQRIFPRLKWGYLQYLHICDAFPEPLPPRPAAGKAFIYSIATLRVVGAGSGPALPSPKALTWLWSCGEPDATAACPRSHRAGHQRGQPSPSLCPSSWDQSPPRWDTHPNLGLLCSSSLAVCISTS